ncbi:MAG: type I 3-dehydroquinate dehydratase [bacterium]|nr:type I 3-dehydroquinate dehydratase [bacterium]
MLNVKGYKIGCGEPLICVPIVETNRDSILSKVNRLKACNTQMIEWRMDWFEAIQDQRAVLELLAQISEIAEAGQMILLVTYRSKAQGGEGTLEEKQVVELLIEIGKSKKADLIDVEFFAVSDAKRIIEHLHRLHARVVASHHDFKETPAMKEMYGYLQQMYDADADILKIAMMPNKSTDVASLLMVTASFHEVYPNTPLITMSMGSLGVISRAGGETFGSCVTFGADGVASAPGQMNKDELREVLTKLHQSIAGVSDNIYLIGFMGTGKSAVSEALQELTGRTIVDMDTVLSKKAGMPIPQIFERLGEDAFRDMESELIEELSKQSHLIVSCGGGVILRNSNLLSMKNSGTVVLLTATARTILERVRFDNNRPLLQGKKNLADIQEMLDARQPAYDRAKDIEVSTDKKNTETIAKEILTCITER